MVRHFHSKDPEDRTSSRQWKLWVPLWELGGYTTLQNGPKLFDGFSVGAAYLMIKICIQEQNGE